jgi:hypothetical protein
MNKLVYRLIVMLLASQTVALCAQMTEKSSPTFTLALSMGVHGGAIPQELLVLHVKITNTTDHVIHQSFCWAIGGLYNVEVLYNSTPLAETKAHQKARKSREAGVCTHRGGRDIDPGESLDDDVYYDPLKPGRYEFTAEQDTTPHDPKKNATVRSNSLTVIVPESGSTPSN